MLGMISFAVAHIAYFTAFGMNPLNFRLAVFLFLLTTPLNFLYIYLINEYLLKFMVSMYIILISAMLWRAISTMKYVKNNFEWTKLFCSIGNQYKRNYLI